MFYVVAHTYVGQNQDHAADADFITIRTTPARTNRSRESITDGWAGTTNDWSVCALGAYATLDQARAAIVERVGPVRLDDGRHDPDVVEAYCIGEYADMGKDTTGDWIHAACDYGVTADTTDAQLKSILSGCEAEANSQGYTLDSSALDMMIKYRADLLADQCSDE